jgi:transglutaminase-like putative cysteine protease
MEAIRGRQVKLRAGMVLEGNSHGVEIPCFDNEAIQNLNEDFRARYDTAVKESEVAEYITDYIHQEFDYDNPTDLFNPDTGEQIENPVDLSFSTEYGVGRCKEQAAVACLLMQMNGINAAYVKGRYPRWDDEKEEYTHGKHAWLKVDSEEGQFFADPTNNHFEPYDEFTDEYKGIGIYEISQEVRVKNETQKNAVDHFF